KSFSGLFKNFYRMGINVIVYLCASPFHSERRDQGFPFSPLPEKFLGVWGLLSRSPHKPRPR
ncbi:MAG: hypothetical protein IKJ35_07710, partial [Clostridia bacterium]|nr:hypothetical protein [Clostridia bacterium]